MGGVDIEEKYYVNQKKKNKVITELLVSKNDFQNKKRVANFFKTLGILILIGITIFLFWGFSFSIFGLGLGIGVGICFGCIPYLIGCAYLKKAKVLYGRPFSVRYDEYLEVNTEGIRYVFNNRDLPNTEMLDVYEISFDKIKAIRVDEKVLRIFGEGVLSCYEDYLKSIVSKDIPSRYYRGGEPYEILLAFNQNEQLLMKLDKYIKKG